VVPFGRSLTAGAQGNSTLEDQKVMDRLREATHEED
jgi:hypothetical protein